MSSKNSKKTYKLKNKGPDYLDFERFVNLYRDLREELNLETPLQSCSDPLVTINKSGERESSYLWELYALNEKELLMIEAYGGVNACSPKKDFPKKIKDIKQFIGELKITVHDPQKETLSRIETIIEKHSESNLS